MDANQCVPRGTSGAGGRDTATVGRALLLEVARRRFLTEGYAAASMAEIAADAGVTKAALYYHFPGKDALFVAVCAAEVERVHAGIEAIAVAGGTLVEALTAVANFAFREAGDGAVRLIDDLMRHVDPTVHEMGFTDRPSPGDVLVRIIAERQDELRPGLDPVFVADAFYGLVMSRMQAKKGRGRSEPIGPEVARALVDLFLFGAIAR